MLQKFGAAPRDQRDKAEVASFVARIVNHPVIVVGRLQHVLNGSFMNE